MSEHSHAPWDARQVANLQARQERGDLHPYTCADRGDQRHAIIYDPNGQVGVLYPTRDGWRCYYCDYTQDWAHTIDLEQGGPPVFTLEPNITIPDRSKRGS